MKADFKVFIFETSININSLDDPSIQLKLTNAVINTILCYWLILQQIRSKMYIEHFIRYCLAEGIFIRFKKNCWLMIGSVGLFAMTDTLYNESTFLLGIAHSSILA